MALTGLLAPAALGFRVRWRGNRPSAYVSAELPLQGFLHVSKLWDTVRSQGSNVVVNEWNTQILMNVPSTYVSGGTNSKAKTLLDCNTCSLRAYVRASYLHAEHA